MSTSDNKALVASFYQLMNARRFEEMWQLFSPDATWSGGGNPPLTTRTLDEMRLLIVDPIPVFVDGGIRYTLHAMTAEHDRVAAEVESYAPLVNGAVYNNRYHMLFVIRDATIRAVKEYGDTLHAREVFVDSGAMTSERLGGDLDG